ncbi:MAG: hypothetical protein RI565_07700, partial [Schleiferiaceae bacterium]|nr:hypothetical protein [Schleiferiaceae bacterium]
MLIGKYYPTMDGAAHLYNSNIINELLWSGNELFEAFFKFNDLFVPNWIGHFILSLFNLFLPAFLAEKILLLCYLIGLPFSFRFFIKSVAPENVAYSYLIFPFCYTFPFILGFYNFSLAIILMLITFNYWQTKFNNFSPKQSFILFSLFTLTFFSHVFVFILVLFLISLHILFSALHDYTCRAKKMKILLKETGRRAWFILKTAFIPLSFFGFYFISTINLERSYTFLGADKLIDWIEKVRPIIAYNANIESVYTDKIFYIILTLFILSLYERINTTLNEVRPAGKRKLNLEVKHILKKSDFWLLSVVLIAVFYFILPNSDQVAGFFSVRFALLLFILLITWLSTQKIRRWVIWFSIIFVIYFNLRLNVYYAQVIKDLNNVAVNCEKAAAHIEPNSIVLPINNSDNWLAGHFSNYLGVNKPIVILENYELATGYFPLEWKNKSIPNLLLGDHASGSLSCPPWKTNKNNSKKAIDYVFVLG